MVWTPRLVMQTRHKAYFLTPETQSPYNRAGSLSVWSDDRLVILEGHMRRGDVVRINIFIVNFTTLLGPQPKHYTTNDIKFDPTRQVLYIFNFFQYFISSC